MSRAPSRQPSTTSLGKYMRSVSPPPHGENTSDFCNAFWGVDDVGVSVLFARMRGAQRTMEELKHFWKERAAIEDDYSKRLAKLAKHPLGKDEIGDVKNCLDIVVLETQNMSKFHGRLAYTISRELEMKAAQFLADQQTHKKTWQNPIEKDYKAKLTQEGYVLKAREKYEQDCMRINSYTAQSTLVQGKDLDKITLKLERAQQNVHTNERDYFNFSKAYVDTSAKWEQAWKAFCDSCQDLEEERLDFVKDSLWAFANVVSAVCVFDDNSCEKLRVALEDTEVDRDMENFVRDYGTGNLIPDPPGATDYNDPQAIPASSSERTFHTAEFARTSRPHKKRTVADRLSEEDPSKAKRDQDVVLPTRHASPSPVRPPPPLEEEEPAYNMAGLGAGGAPRSSVDEPSSANSSSSTANVTRKPTNVSRKPIQDPNTGDPIQDTFMKIGDTAYKVDLTNDPQNQQGRGPTVPQSGIASPRAQTPASSNDPLARTLEELTREVSTTGSIRRNNTYRQSSQAPPPPPVQTAGGSGSYRSPQYPAPARKQTLDAPPQQSVRSTSPSRDYRNSAEMVVGAHPSVSRPTSPNTNDAGPQPPSAAFMQPRSSMDQGPSETDIQGMLADYQQSLPGERKSIAQSASRRASFSAASPSNENIQGQQQQGHSHSQSLGRPPSAMGHAGVGAHGGSRSNSPQPMSRGASPSARGPSPGYMAPPPPNPVSIARSPSPNSVGIALDASGRVMHDEMALRYQQQQHQQQQQQHPQRQAPPIQQQYTQAPPPHQQQPVQRQTSYVPPPPPPVQPPPPIQQQPPYVPTATTGYVRQPYSSPPVQAPYSAPPPAPSYPAYAAPPPPQQQNGLQRGSSVGAGGGGGYYGGSAPPNGRQMSVHGQGGASGYQTSPYGHGRGHTSPSPAPPPPQPAPVEDPVLFYVKALYDYVATIDEEFDFQAGDIIAVTSTPEDGWWTGHLLDEVRVNPGKNVFPSNFVCLF